MKTREEEIYILANGFYYKATKWTTDDKETIGIGGRSLELLVQGNKELVKESFKVNIGRYDNFYDVTVTSNKTGESSNELAYLFPRWTARKLKKQIIKKRKTKNYKKEYTI